MGNNLQVLAGPGWYRLQLYIG